MISPNRRALAASLLAIAVVLWHPVQAQSPAEQIASIQKKLTSFLRTTQVTPDGTDLVPPAGSVLVLQKGEIVLVKPVTGGMKMILSKSGYAKGKISPLGATVMDRFMACKGAQDCSRTAFRVFQAGEKFFLTNIGTYADGVTFTFMSDVFGDSRFAGQLVFPFPKGGPIPSADDVIAQIVEVLKLDDGQ